MVSINYPYSDGTMYYDLRGLSTDSKPTDVTNGSTFIEMDTGKKYLYDATGEQWREVDSSIIISATGVRF